MTSYTMDDKRLMALEGWSDVKQVPLIDPKDYVGKKPNKIIPVPKEFQRQLQPGERRVLAHEIRVDTNCVVFAKFDKHRGIVYQFDIFGSGHGIEKATVRLNEWITNAKSTSKYSQKWAKLSAFDFNRWYYDRVDELEDDRRLKFKGEPPHDQPLHLITIDWPKDLTEEGETPRSAFGNKLETLEGLCVQDEVYLSHVSGQFQLRASHPRNLEIAKVHLRTIFDTVRDSKLDRSAFNLLLDYREGMDVTLEYHPCWWPRSNYEMMPRLLPSGMMEVPGTFRTNPISLSQLEQLQNAIERALIMAGRRKGAYDMAIRLGSLALDPNIVSAQKAGVSFPKDKFLREVSTTIEMDVKKWLVGNDIGPQILKTLKTAEDLLKPARPTDSFGQAPKELNETRPTLRGRFVFRDPSQATSKPKPKPRHIGRPKPLNDEPEQDEEEQDVPESLFVVQLDWTEDENERYEKGAPRFYKLEPGKMGPRKSMEVTLLELGQSRGWHFALESLIPLSKKSISPVLSAFAAGVDYDPEHGSRPFARLNLSKTMEKFSVTYRLDKTYTFGIKDTAYIVELSEMWYSKTPRSSWGLSVRHLDWASHLTELERLPVGAQADWGDTLSTFFPEDEKSLCGDNKDATVPGDSRDGCVPRLGDLNLGSKAETNEKPRFAVRMLVEKLMRLSELVDVAASLPRDVDDTPVGDKPATELPAPRIRQTFSAIDYSAFNDNDSDADSDGGVSIAI